MSRYSPSPGRAASIASPCETQIGLSITKTRFSAPCSSKPASSRASAKGLDEPSGPGASSASSSTTMLSMASPLIAARMCSIVWMETVPSSSEVRRSCPPARLAMVALIRAGLGRSVRRKTVPVLVSAGQNRARAGAELKSPWPATSTGVLMVL